MKILLTGGFGFVGKRFIEKLSTEHEIIVYAKTESNNTMKSMIETGLIETKNIIDVITKHKPEAVVHLAALSNINECQTNPEGAFRVNVYGTFNVIEGCIKNKSKLIFLSSREVYGESLNEQSNENDKSLPNNILGITKMLAENLVLHAGEKDNLDYTILRPTNIYGPGGKKSGIHRMITNALNNGKITIFGGGQLVNLLYVDDLVRIINITLNNRYAFKQIFNVGSKDTVTIDRIAEIIANTIGYNVEIEYMTMRGGETTRFIPDLTKLETILKYSAETTITKGIEDTLRWIKKN